MAKMGKYGLGFKWAPEFPWMLPNASEKLGNPERSEEDGFCPSAAQEPKVKGKTLVNHVRVDCSRLPALECCVQSAIIRDIFVDEDPQKVEASTMMALQFGSAVLVKPSKRLSIQAWANLGVLPKTAAMGLFKRFCLCNTRECVCDAHVAFQLFTVQPDGVCLGNGRFIGWFVPVTAIPEYAKQWLQPWSILLRKGGNKGSVTSGHFRRAVTMPVYDFNVEDACEEVHLNPKGKYSCKAYALLKGYRGVKPILFVDQYGCDYTGCLAKGLEDYGDLTLSEMKELFPVWRDSLDNEVVVAWHVDRDPRAVMRLQTLATVRGIDYVGQPTEDVVDGDVVVREPAHLLAANAIVKRLPRLVETMLYTDSSVTEFCYKTKLCECGFITQFGYVDCCGDTCDFRGWVAGNMMDGFPCPGCTINYMPWELEAQSSGVIPEGGVLFTQSTDTVNRESFKLYGHAVVPFGSAVYWSPCPGMWLPIIWSSVKAYAGLTYTGVVGCKAIVQETDAICRSLYMDYVQHKCGNLEQRAILGLDDVYHRQLLVNRGDYSLLLENVDLFVKRRAEFACKFATCGDGLVPLLLDGLVPRSYYLIKSGHAFTSVMVNFSREVVDMCMDMAVLFMHDVKVATKYVKKVTGKLAVRFKALGVAVVRKITEWFDLAVDTAASAAGWLCYQLVNGLFAVADGVITFVQEVPEFVKNFVDKFKAFFKVLVDSMSVSILAGLTVVKTASNRVCLAGSKIYDVVQKSLSAYVLPAGCSEATCLVGETEPAVFEDDVVDVVKAPLTYQGCCKPPTSFEKICIVDKLYMAKCGDQFYPVVVDNDTVGVLDQCWRFPCAGKKVEFNDKPKVKEIPTTRKITIIFALDATFDSVLSKACSEFEVDKDVTLDELLDVVLDAVESTLSPCKEHDVIGTKVCALLERLVDDYVYLFDEGGDEVIAPRMYCSFSAPDDEDCVAADVVHADVNQDDDADDSVVLVADARAEDGVAKEQVDLADSEICVAHTGSQEELIEPDAVGSQTPIASAEETEVGEASDREGIAEAKATVCADALDACPVQVEAFDIEKVEDSILDELQTELNAPADKTYEDVVAFDALYSEALSAFYAVPSDETHFKVCGFYSPAIERTNCWLRSTLIVMQSLPLEFKDLEMQTLWLSYKAGYDQCFVDKLIKSVPRSIILPQGGYVADFAYFFLSQCSFKAHANWRCLKCDMELKLQGLDAMFFYGDVVSHMCKCGNSMTLLSADIPYTLHFGVRDDKFCAFYTPRKVFRAACAVDVNDCHSMAVVEGKQIDGRVVTKFTGDKFDFMVGYGMTFSMSPFELAQLYGSCITPNVCFVKGDVIKVVRLVNAEVIVNPANGRMAHGAGVAGAIAKAAGKSFSNETADMVKRQGVCQVGECYESTGGKLCKKVLNIVGPDARGHGKQCYSLLERAYQHINKCDNVVTTLISAGIFSVPTDVSLTYLLGVVTKNAILVSNNQDDFDVIEKCQVTSVAGTKALSLQLAKNLCRDVKFVTNACSSLFSESCFVSSYDVLQEVEALRHDIQLGDDARVFVQANMDCLPADWRLVNKFDSVDGVRTINYFECPGGIFVSSQGKKFGYVQNGSFKEASVSQIRALLANKVDVLCTVDGVNFRSCCVAVGEVFGKTLGSVFCDGINVTKVRCSAIHKGKVFFQYSGLSAADLVAVRDAFGFDEPQLLKYYNMLGMCKWPVVVCGNYFAFKQSNNNCYINVACLMLQHLSLKFPKWQWQEAWNEFRSGKPLRFVSLVLAKGSFKFNEPSDSTDFIRVVLREADLSGATCDLEFICKCGVKQEQRKGVDAVMHFGTLDKSDLVKGYNIACTCGDKLVHCTQFNVPFLICSNTPEGKKLPDDVVAANIFTGGSVGHYTHVKCKPKYQLYDACNVSKVSEAKGNFTDCLYLKNLKQTISSVLTTYYLDDVKCVAYRPDLSQYYCESGKYYTKPIIKAQFRMFEKVEGVYTNFKLVGHDIAGKLNAKLGFDCNSPFVEYKITEWPTATGDVVLASDDLYVGRYAGGCVTFGKPVIWLGHEEASLKSLTYFNRPSVVCENKFNVLPVDVSEPTDKGPGPAAVLVTGDQSGVMATEPGIAKEQKACASNNVEEQVVTEVRQEPSVAAADVKEVKLNGVKKPVKVEDSVVVNDPTSETKVVKSLSIVDVYDMFLTGCRYVVWTANELSRLVNSPTVREYVKWGMSKLIIPANLLFLRDEKQEFVAPKVVKAKAIACYGAVKWFLLYCFSWIKFNTDNKVIYTTEVASKLTFKLCCLAFKNALQTFNWSVVSRGFFLVATVFLLWFNFLYANVVLSDFYLPNIGFFPTFVGQIVAWFKTTFGVSTICDFYQATDMGYRSSFCNGSMVCELCFSGFDMLDNYDAINVVQHVVDRRVSFDYISLFKLVVELVIGYSLYTVCFYPLFVLIGMQLLTTWLPEFFMLETMHWSARLFVFVANMLPAFTLLRFYIVVTAMYKVYCLCRHVMYGCSKPGCLFCYKRNRSVRVKCSTVVGGSLRYYDVMANGGTGFCTKHQWNCLNCNSWHPGNTFITHEAAADLSKELKRPVNPTDSAYYSVTEVKQVGCSMRLFYERDGQRVYDDVSASLFVDMNGLLHSKVKGVPETHVVVVENEADKAGFLGAAVFYAQSLYRPMLMVEKKLITTANTGLSVSRTMFDLYVDSLLNVLDVDRKSLTSFVNAAHNSLKEGVQLEQVMDTFVGCARRKCAIDSDVETKSITKSVMSAVNAGVDFTDESCNNLVPTYVKSDTIVAADLGVLIQNNAKHVQANVAKAANVACIWSVDAFNQLSADLQHRLRKACSKTGLKIKLTYNKQEASVPILTTPFSLKGGAVFGKMLQWLFVANLICFIVLWALMPTYAVHKSDMQLPLYASFKVIDNGVLRDVSVTDACFANKFNQFDQWYESTFGLAYYRNSKACPVVVAVIDQDIGHTLFNVPTKVLRYGFHVLHFITHAFATDSVQCYTPHMQIPYDNFYASGCVLSSLCTMLAHADGTPHPYCYTEGVMHNASLYSSLAPHVRYNLASSNGYIRFPEVVSEGIVRVVRTRSMTYCRVGLCEEAEEGICFNFNGSWVLNNPYYRAMPGTFCGRNAFDLIYQVLGGLVRPIDFLALTASSVAGAILAIVVVLAFYYLIKLKRAFGDYTSVVVINVIVWCINFLMLFVFQVYPTLSCLYACFYFYTTLYFPSEISVVMHLQWLVMYGAIMPLWFCIIYVAVVVSNHALWLFSYCRKIGADVRSDGTFEEMALTTFMITKESYCKLKNSVSDVAFNRYLSLYNKYRYFSGKMDTAAYREAACSQLAKAMETFNHNNGNDVLYQPPTASVTTSFLQSGIVKMVSPTSKVEPCIVSVTYGNMTLNGLWLDDKVYCPRHVICSSADMTDPDYPNLLCRVTSSDFCVMSGRMNLTVMSYQMQGSLLVLTVTLQNPNTPKYSFGVVKPGETFTVLAAYNGRPQGAFHVTMRSSHTIKGSFLCGSCGSVGYVLTGDSVRFVYMHQLELSTGCHTGTDFSGNFYGPYRDAQVVQLPVQDYTQTVNVVAWLYAAILNRCNWFVQSDSCSLEEFNVWAMTNGFSSIKADLVLDALASMTGVTVEQVLAAIRRLHSGFQGKQILGSCVLEDELTPSDVYQQLAGVKLQSKRTRVIKGTFCWVLASTFLFCSIISAFVKWTMFMYVTTHMLGVTLCALCFVSFAMLLIKHKHLYLTMYIMPVLCTLFYTNYLVVYKQSFRGLAYAWLSHFVPAVDYTYMDEVLYGVVLLVAMVFVTMRSINHDVFSIMFLVGRLVSLVSMWYFGANLEEEVLLLLTSLFGTYTWTTMLSLATAKVIAKWLAVNALYFTDVPQIKLVLLSYLCIGYVCCCYWGVLSLLNSIFRMPLGVYNYKISVQELRYMNANGLRPPRNSFEALMLNFKLLGIGGVPVIEVSQIQSRLTDVKCANVVLLNCLQHLHIASNSKLWQYCSTLHNEILATSDLSVAFDKLAQLLIVLFANPAAVDSKCLASIEEVSDDYVRDNTVLQALQSEFVNMASFVEYELAKKNLDEAKASGSANQQQIKQLEKACNIAKSAYERDRAVARKLERMADLALTNMYKEARINDKKSKVVSALQTMLFSMVRKLDNQALNSILDNAVKGCVPLNAIPSLTSNTLTIIVPDKQVFDQVVDNVYVTYAGNVWHIQSIQDADGAVKQLNEIDVNSTWPLVIAANRHNEVSTVVLQNNELMPQKLRTQVVNSGPDMNCNTPTQCYYNTTGTGKIVYAILSDSDGLKYTKIVKEDGNCVVLELDPPCKFSVQDVKGLKIKYLYFVKGCNTLARGWVVGTLSSTVRLQAGTATEYASNSAILSLCAFSVDPKKTYLDYIQQGGVPVTNCVKMLCDHAGTGMAITIKPEATTNQDSYGGASVCIYCRSRVEHPDVDGLCKLRGKFVQVPLGIKDPVSYVLTHDVCQVCGFWRDGSCSCVGTSSQFQSKDTNFLNGFGVQV